jgi:hypothetical protein
MERIWNYLFYLQFRKLENYSLKFVHKPIQNIYFYLFPKKNYRKSDMDNAYYTFINNRKNGLNLGFAFRFMNLTTTIFYGIILLYFNVIIGHKVKEDFKYFLIGAFLLSYATNYWFLWRNDTYLKYFQQFEKETFSRWNYMYLFLFHAGILVFGIASIHMTIGFNF